MDKNWAEAIQRACLAMLLTTMVLSNAIVNKNYLVVALLLYNYVLVAFYYKSRFDLIDLKNETKSLEDPK